MASQEAHQAVLVKHSLGKPHNTEFRDKSISSYKSFSQPGIPSTSEAIKHSQR